MVKKDRKDINFDPENPDSGGLSSSIEIRNGDYSYQLTSVIDKISKSHNSTTLLNVINKGKILRTIHCIPNSEYGSLTSLDPAYLGSMQWIKYISRLPNLIAWIYCIDIKIRKQIKWMFAAAIISH